MAVVARLKGPWRRQSTDEVVSVKRLGIRIDTSSRSSCAVTLLLGLSEIANDLHGPWLQAEGVEAGLRAHPLSVVCNAGAGEHTLGDDERWTCAHVEAANCRTNSPARLSVS
jgi:hypothetical protein